jgi:lactoylglutathione lyase
MKGLAFALDPDGYWVEILKKPTGTLSEEPNFSQVMIRVKEARAALGFFSCLGFREIAQRHFEKGQFSLFFMTHNPGEPVDTTTDDAWEAVKTIFDPVLELTHNHGTEDKQGWSYHNGNVDPVGFGYITVAVDDLKATKESLAQKGYSLIVGEDGEDIVLCPNDHYHIVLVQK